MFSSPVQPRPCFSQLRKISEIFGRALAAARLLVLLAIVPIGRAQTADPANLLSDLPAAANPSPAANPNRSAEPTGGGLLPSVVVTGYLIPRVGEGPQPVATLNQDFIQKQAYQTINDVLNNYPGGPSVQNTQTFAGNSNSPGSSAFGLKSLGPGATLILIDGYRFPQYAISINAGAIPFVDLNSCYSVLAAGSKVYMEN